MCVCVSWSMGASGDVNPRRAGILAKPRSFKPSSMNLGGSTTPSSRRGHKGGSKHRGHSKKGGKKSTTPKAKGDKEAADSKSTGKKSVEKATDDKPTKRKRS